MHLNTIVTASPKQNQRCVVWLHHRVRHLWWRNHRECFHDTVWVLFSHLGNQECSHACTSASTKGMAKLKSLKAITTFGLLANDIKHGVDQLSSLSVVTFSPVVSCSSLAEDKVVWTEQLAKGPARTLSIVPAIRMLFPIVPKWILHWKRLYKITLQQNQKSHIKGNSRIAILWNSNSHYQSILQGSYRSHSTAIMQQHATTWSILAQDPSRRHEAHSAHQLLRWNIHWCAPRITSDLHRSAPILIPSLLICSKSEVVWS